MIVNIANGIKTALKPIQESIDNIQKSSDLILQQESRIKKLTAENEQLLSEVKQVRCELKEFKERLSSLENKSLECNLIFRGVEEPLNETSEGLKERLYWIMADTIDNPNPAERLSAAKGCSICYCHQLGKPNPTRPRPISVEFDRRVDADIVYDSRFYLTQGVFIDQEFNLETEKCRRTLHPILHAAKQKSEYRYKSRLEGAKLVTDGKRYGVNDLDWLPDSLHPFEVSTKSNEETLGFFGELCPFSNFYPIDFTFNGATYHSSEQLIQHQKVLSCNDYETVDKIMLTKSVLACKQLSYSIKNYDHQGWTNAANEQCCEGLRAKFSQNPSLLHILLSTGDKLLVECSKDNIWGTGVPLYRWDCLQKRHWTGNGKLSDLLMEIRNACKETTAMDVSTSPPD